MSKRNFFVSLLFTACFVWAIANTAEAGKPFCGDGKCSNKENSCDCPSDCTPPPTETNCTDRTDNDCDGLIDCDDPDCGPPPYIEVCNDDTDNDCDGLIDCDDDDCDGVAVCDQTPCGDGYCTGDETCSSCEADCGSCPVPELLPGPKQPAAHDGNAVRAVGFATYELDKTWIVSGGEDAHLRNWTIELAALPDDQTPPPFQTLDHTIYDLEVSVDRSIVATGEGGWNGSANSDTLRIWDAHGFRGTQAPIGYCMSSKGFGQIRH